MLTRERKKRFFDYIQINKFAVFDDSNVFNNCTIHEGSKRAQI